MNDQGQATSLTGSTKYSLMRTHWDIQQYEVQNRKFLATNCKYNRTEGVL